MSNNKIKTNQQQLQGINKVWKRRADYERKETEDRKEQRQMHKLVWPNEQNQIRIASHKKCSAGYKRDIKVGVVGGFRLGKNRENGGKRGENSVV